MLTEIVYLSHDNTIDLILKADGVAVNLSSVTKMTVTFEGVTLTSTNKSTDPILWNQVGYELGEVRLVLGGTTIVANSYRNVYLVVYDPIYPDGIVWGSLYIKVLPEVESL
jgi:hypothetical protein